jgi:serine/threonine protein kinase
MADDYEIAGKGSFGIIVNPAIPNMNNNGNEILFPHNVSKIYKNVSSYKNALNASKKIKNQIPELNISTNTYRRRYTLKTLPNSIKNNVKKYFKKTNSELSNNDVLPILRMPNLGYSAEDIRHDSALYRRLRQLPFRKICSEMYKCMNIVKAINSAGYIHGDIRESNLLFNLDNMTMTIIDFDWLKPFNEIYNTYPEFFYSWPPECLFVFGRTTKGGKKIDISTLFKPDMTFRSDGTISGFYDSVYNKYDYYIPYDATIGMRNFLNNIRPFRSNARNQNERYDDIEYYTNNTRNELFNITKDYVDMYGLGIALYKLLKHAWYVNVNIHGLQVGNDGNVLPLNDISKYIKESGASIGGIDINNNSEIEKFSNIRKFIFDELLPGIVHSNYTKRWTIDEALDKFREKLDEMDKDLLENEEKIVSDELKRLELLALLHNDIYKGFNNIQALIGKKPYNNSANPFSIFANNNNINNNNKRNGGKSNISKRKTRKNKRN